MRTSLLLILLVAVSPAASAHDGDLTCASNSEVEYARYRARLCDAARNADIEAQRHYFNASYLRLYHTPRLASIPSRMIDPNLPVRRPR